MLDTIKSIVSVPYRGATFLNNQYRVTYQTLQSIKFPSPIGELHFSIYKSRRKKDEKIVSVPYRGATFLNKYDKLNRLIFSVSVPYRGATFLNRTVTIDNEPWFVFPSPIGELHFSIRNPVNCWKTFWPSFRPLSGSYISQ